MTDQAEQHRQAIEKYVEAWTTGNKALLLSVFAEDAEWSDPVGTPVFKGHAGVEKFWDFSHQDAGRQLTPKVEDIRVCGAEAILRFTMQVRIPDKNQGLDLSIVDYFQFDEAGKIKVAKAFWGPADVRQPPGMDLFAPNIDQAYDS